MAAFVAHAAAGAAGAVCIACGRVGYDPIADSPAAPDAGKVRDASIDRTAGGDATTDAAPDAAEDVVEDTDALAPFDGAVDDATVEDALLDAGSDADLDAVSDAAPEAEAGCPDGDLTDYCNVLPAMATVPVIDGVLDLSACFLVDMTPEFWSGPPPLPPFPPGNSTQIAAAWRPDGLYVFLAVTTPADFPADSGDPVFFGAGVELFIDSDGLYPSAPAYDSPGAIQIVVTSPASPTAPSERAEEYRNATDEGPWASTQFGTFPTAAGFVFEGFVAAADLGLTTWSLSSGATVGLDVAVDVSFTTAAMTGPQGHRVGQYFFHVAPDDAGIGAPFSDPRSFCTPTLAGP